MNCVSPSGASCSYQHTNPSVSAIWSLLDFCRVAGGVPQPMSGIPDCPSAFKTSLYTNQSMPKPNSCAVCFARIQQSKMLCIYIYTSKNNTGKPICVNKNMFGLCRIYQRPAMAAPNTGAGPKRLRQLALL